MKAQTTFKGVHWMLLAVIALAPATVVAQEKTEQPSAAPAQTPATENGQALPEATQAKADQDPKVISGMSILGNQEAPKALVIVPWKSSEIGAAMGVSTKLDDSRQPVDKEVFMRMLSYHEIRSSSPGTGVAAKTNAAPVVTVAQGRK